MASAWAVALPHDNTDRQMCGGEASTAGTRRVTVPERLAGYAAATTTDASDISELRAAEQALAVALGADDPLAWVDHYTDNAHFVAPGAPAIIGRAGLLE